MREIEVKYQVGDMEALLAALKAWDIELGEPIFQDDQAYMLLPSGSSVIASSASRSSAYAL